MRSVWPTSTVAGAPYLERKSEAIGAALGFVNFTSSSSCSESILGWPLLILEPGALQITSGVSVLRELPCTWMQSPIKLRRKERLVACCEDHAYRMREIVRKSKSVEVGRTRAGHSPGRTPRARGVSPIASGAKPFWRRGTTAASAQAMACS